MTDKIQLSRRKILGSVGAVGAAGAAAGLGTSALFSDEESFTNNSITAGTLDLKVDWEEHYSYPQIYGFDDPEDELDVTRTDPQDTENYVGLPDPESPVLWVHRSDLDAYMDATSIEAFPDFNGDGTQDAGNAEVDYVPCEDGADTPEDLDPTGLRTDNGDTSGEEGYKPLVALDDVKPGDFGELTLSFHLCDNPGYVWLDGALDSASEGVVTEPEDESEDEGEGVELLDEVQTAWWYDTDGDNVLDETQGAVDVMVLLDRSGSLNSSEYGSLQSAANDLVDQLLGAGDVQVGGITFGDNDGVSVTRVLGTSDFDFPSGTTLGSNNTPMPPALDIADRHLDDTGRSGAEQVIVLLTDGGPNYQNQVYNSSVGDAPRDGTWSADASDQAYDNATAGKDGTVSSGELDETELVATNIKTPSGNNTGDTSRIVTVGIGDPENVGGTTLDEFLRDRVATSTADHYNANFDNIGDIVNDVAVGVAVGEQVFRRGNLRDDLAALETGDGIPLDGDLSTDFDELNDPADSSNRECFEPSTTHYVGFAWWVPTEVGNQIQDDSASFDLGFYTEQCRNNDGAGNFANNGGT